MVFFGSGLADTTSMTKSSANFYMQYVSGRFTTRQLEYHTILTNLEALISTPFTELEQQARALPAEERARLVEILLAPSVRLRLRISRLSGGRRLQSALRPTKEGRHRRFRLRRFLPKQDAFFDSSWQ